MSEQKLQAKILTWLDEQGFYTVKAIACNRKGVPDILACSPRGVFVAIEVKFGKNKPSKLQEWNIERIQECKGFAMVCWDLESLAHQLKKEGIIL